MRQFDIYVDASAAAGGSGVSWDSPFRTIQEAVDAVRLDGTTVHVKPGVYGPAKFDKTKFYENGLSCTITVKSTDGPEKTIIDGGWRGESSFPTSACFCYGDDISTRLNDTIRGFTLHGSFYGVENGRVEYCIVSNCVKGVRGASAYNCLITGNTDIGFGGDGLQNCTVVGNATGVTLPRAVNSVIWGNGKDGAYDSSFWYATNCCIPVVSLTNKNNIVVVGPGNIMKDPRFVDAATGDYRLRPDSPCIDTGAGGRLSAWESYLWDLDPTNSSQYPHAEIEMTDGAPRVKVVPASANRSYSLLGKPALDAQNWARSLDLANAAFLSTNRFFRIAVELK